jgi:Domain of unknown function (DUF929)
MNRLALLVVATFSIVAGAAAAASHSDGSKPAPAHIAQLVTHVPASALDGVGAGQLLGGKAFIVTKLSGAPLQSGGMPEVLTMNLAWCPHCAANSWALAIALSRFGSLSHLRIIDTGTFFCKHAHPCYPHTNGLSFLAARLSSSTLSFTHLVLQDVSGHKLQSPSAQEQAALKSFDPQGGAPAVDVGGVYGFVNSGYSPGVLAGKSWSQIASALAQPKSLIAKHVDGLANLFTAAMCKATGGKPSSVCGSNGVTAAAARLPLAPPPAPPAS